MFMFSNSESNVMDANYSCLVDKESLPSWWYIRGHVGFSQEVEEKIDIPRRKKCGATLILFCYTGRNQSWVNGSI